MYSILKKELIVFFGSITGYLITALFLLLTSLFLWVIPGDYNIFDTGYAQVDGLFQLAPWLFLFLCPAVTMSAFTDEKRSGTWELLITKPISKWNIVLGKYAATLIVILIALMPTTIHYWIVWYIAEPIGNIDSGAFWGSFVGLIFLSALFLAIGIFSSSLASNAIVSFVMAAIISVSMFYGFDLLTSFVDSVSLQEIIRQAGIHSHYQSMSRGVIDSRDIAYFLFSTIAFLFFTTLKISKK